MADTELYGSLGEMLGCESTSEIFNSTEVGVMRQMLEEASRPRVIRLEDIMMRSAAYFLGVRASHYSA